MNENLAGVRIVITRAASQQEELAARLASFGAEVIGLPLIQIAPPSDPQPLRDAARRAHEWDWIIFTSANAVRAFADELPLNGDHTRARIAVVGSATRRAAEALGFPVNIMPEEYVAESLVKAFSGIDLRGAQVLIPQSALARDVAAEELRKLGANVWTPEAYRNIVPRDAGEQLTRIFETGAPDWILFASPSAATNFAGLIENREITGVRMGSIGPVTSAALRTHGMRVDAEADPHTAEGMAAMLLNIYMG